MTNWWSRGKILFQNVKCNTHLFISNKGHVGSYQIYEPMDFGGVSWYEAMYEIGFFLHTLQLAQCPRER